ncbi:GNAT family N-acetyltransferase [Cetobacterium somerae]|uniref:GNAT family N-acetyltransferase n=1 Tax=Cetobacterium sp. NK01 TaxID=2993530 RepID=UPI0021168957|nr:GNAT family N-acetyltransferase [Cetobacterium sp. NK01]MCQ8212457.1 GNAT family N-acetyltransferase [Cetobacterium sp. NK01]
MIIKIDNTNKEILEKISFLEKEIFPESYYSIITLQEMSLKKEYSIIVYDEDVKGYLILHDSYDVYEIMKIAVTTNFRNRKIGQELINFYLEEFNKNLLLEVRETNEIARKFYEKLGFVNIGKRKNYYSNGETAILMSLERN